MTRLHRACRLRARSQTSCSDRHRGPAECPEEYHRLGRPNRRERCTAKAGVCAREHAHLVRPRGRPGSGSVYDARTCRARATGEWTGFVFPPAAAVLPPPSASHLDHRESRPRPPSSGRAVSAREGRERNWIHLDRPLIFCWLNSRATGTAAAWREGRKKEAVAEVARDGVG